MFKQKFLFKPVDIKVTISENSTEILRKFVFRIMFERGKYWGKYEFV